MAVKFPFKDEGQSHLGRIRRPVVQVLFKSINQNIWQPVDMLVDTGADYSLLPHQFSQALGVNLKKDCHEITTSGVGGKSKVYFLKENIRVRLGHLKREVPIGFLEHNLIPPLLGRLGFFETFKVIFEKFEVSFE